MMKLLVFLAAILALSNSQSNEFSNAAVDFDVEEDQTPVAKSGFFPIPRGMLAPKNGHVRPPLFSNKPNRSSEVWHNSNFTFPDFLGTTLVGKGGPRPKPQKPAPKSETNLKDGVHVDVVNGLNQVPVANLTATPVQPPLRVPKPRPGPVEVPPHAVKPITVPTNNQSKAVPKPTVSSVTHVVGSKLNSTNATVAVKPVVKPKPVPVVKPSLSNVTHAVGSKLNTTSGTVAVKPVPKPVPVAGKNLTNTTVPPKKVPPKPVVPVKPTIEVPLRFTFWKAKNQFEFNINKQERIVCNVLPRFEGIHPPTKAIRLFAKKNSDFLVLASRNKIVQVSKKSNKQEDFTFLDLTTTDPVLVHLYFDEAATKPGFFFKEPVCFKAINQTVDANTVYELWWH